MFDKSDPRLKHFLQGTGVRLLHVPGFRVCVYNRKAGYAHTAGSDSCWLRASSCQLAARRPVGAQPCASCCRKTSGRMQQPGARAPSSATVRRITAIAGMCPPGNSAHRGDVCVTCALIRWFGQMPTMATHTARTRVVGPHVCCSRCAFSTPGSYAKRGGRPALDPRRTLSRYAYEGVMWPEIDGYPAIS